MRARTRAKPDPDALHAALRSGRTCFCRQPATCVVVKTYRNEYYITEYRCQAHGAPDVHDEYQVCLRLSIEPMATWAEA